MELSVYWSGVTFLWHSVQNTPINYLEQHRNNVALVQYEGETS